MSIKIMSQVWELDLPANLKFTAIALADWADDQGRNVHPSNALIARKVGIDVRTVQRQIQQLVELGLVEIEATRGYKLRSGQWVRRLRLHPDRCPQIPPIPVFGDPVETPVSRHEQPRTSRGDKLSPLVSESQGVTPASSLDGKGVTPTSPQGVTPTSPNTVIDTLDKEIPPVEILAATRNARPRNPIWDALSSWFGEPETPGETKLRGRIVADLVAAGATPAEVERRVDNWPMLYEGATLTETALLKHWTALGRPPLRATSTQIAAVADRRRREKLLSDAAAQDAARARGLSNGEPTTPPRGGEARRQR